MNQRSIFLHRFLLLKTNKFENLTDQSKFITHSVNMPHPSAAGTNRPVRVCYNDITYKAYRGVRAYEFARVYPAGTTVYPLHLLYVGTCLELPPSPPLSLSLSLSLPHPLLTLAVTNAVARPTLTSGTARLYSIPGNFRFQILHR